MINGIFLLLGSNLGDRKWYLGQAQARLSDLEISIIHKSSLYFSPPWGKEDQPYFLNQALQISTDLSPEALMTACLSTESGLGRIRKEKYGERSIDIDVLYYNQLIRSSERITLPHPRLHLRRFALAPMTELAPDFMHPELKKTQKQLLDVCPDLLPVRRLRG